MSARPQLARAFAAAAILIALVLALTTAALGPLAADWKEPIRGVPMFARLITDHDTVIFGDSRTARAFMDQVPAGTTVFAFGNRRTGEFRRLASIVCGLGGGTRLTIALGVNDALTIAPSPDPAADYLSLAAACPDRQITVVEPWPVEFGKRNWVVRQYTPVAVARAQASARWAARRLGATLRPAPASVAGLTVDGVHFGAQGNRLYRAALLGSDSAATNTR